jgi:hypothetical protein
MRCIHFRRLVVLAREAELSHEQRAGCNLHEAECLACRQFRQDMRGVELLLNLTLGVRAPENFCGAVIQKIKESGGAGRRGGLGLQLAWWR